MLVLLTRLLQNSVLWTLATAEALKMLLSAKGIAPSTEDRRLDLGSDASLNGYINAAAKAGIVNKGTSFNPNGTATRGEAIQMAANAAGLTTTAGAEAGDDLNFGDLMGDTSSTGVTSTGTTSTGTYYYSCSSCCWRS